MMKRKIYQKMLEWKTKSGGSSALLIDGARRVGKSYIASLFAKHEYKSHIIIDFGNVSPEITSLFENESSNLDFFL
ncbi:AAA family ATPase, partial [bacterium]|nr:AAA family ATPase [bacterium]